MPNPSNTTAVPKTPEALKQTGQSAIARLKKLRETYATEAKNKTFNALVYGDSGTGKTQLLSTCRKPVLVHSFDPGGTTTIRDFIERGEIIVDDSFEKENKARPDSFNRWEKEIMAMKRENVFEHLGTYSLDSITLWFDALQRAILQANSIDQLRIQDWGTIMNVVRDWINFLCALPCDVIITGHIDIDKDEVTGKNETTLLLQGASKRKLPLFFDEMYVTTTKKTAKEIQHKLLTQNDGYYKAKTRLGSFGRFEKYEEPNIKAMLKKIGYPYEDKELISL